MSSSSLTKEKMCFAGFKSIKKRTYIVIKKNEKIYIIRRCKLIFDKITDNTYRALYVFYIKKNTEVMEAFYDNERAISSFQQFFPKKGTYTLQVTKTLEDSKINEKYL